MVGRVLLFSICMVVSVLCSCNNTVDITYPACRNRDAKGAEIKALGANLACDTTAQCNYQWYGYKCGNYMARYQAYSLKNTATAEMQSRAAEYNAFDVECLKLTNGATSCDALLPPVLSCTNSVCTAQ